MWMEYSAGAQPAAPASANFSPGFFLTAARIPPGEHHTKLWGRGVKFYTLPSSSQLGSRQKVLAREVFYDILS